MPRKDAVGEAAREEAEIFLARIRQLKTVYCEASRETVLAKRGKYRDCNECTDVSFLVGLGRVGGLRVRKRCGGGSREYVWCLNCPHARDHRRSFTRGQQPCHLSESASETEESASC